MHAGSFRPVNPFVRQVTEESGRVVVWAPRFIRQKAFHPSLSGWGLKGVAGIGKIPAMNFSDLATFHHLITDRFQRSGVGDGDPIGPDELLRFEADGFLSGVRLLTDVQVEILRSELDEIMQPEMASDPRFYEYHHNEAADSGTQLFHALGAWRVSPAFHDLVFLPSVVSAAEALLGGPVRFWHDQLFVKPPRDGAVVEWHQDYSYWTRTKPVAHLTCWIGLDDSHEDNGCVRYVPGSHRWDLLPKYPLSGDMSAVFAFLSDDQKARFKPVLAILKAGEASFHHPMTVHGSFENRSDRPRRGCVINFIRDGVMSDSDEPLLAGVPVIPKGEKLAGQFFPLLSSSFF